MILIIRITIVSFLLFFSQNTLASLPYYESVCFATKNNTYSCSIASISSPDPKLKGDGCIVGTGLKISANADAEYQKVGGDSVRYRKTLSIKKININKYTRKGTFFLSGKSCKDVESEYYSRSLSDKEMAAILNTPNVISEKDIRRQINEISQKQNKPIDNVNLFFDGHELIVNNNLKYTVISVSGNSFFGNNSKKKIAIFLIRTTNRNNDIVWSWNRVFNLYYNNYYSNASFKGLFNIENKLYYYFNEITDAHFGITKLVEDKNASDYLQ